MTYHIDYRMIGKRYQIALVTMRGHNGYLRTKRRGTIIYAFLYHRDIIMLKFLDTFTD